MAYLIKEKDELSSYLKLIELIKENGYKSSRYLELPNCLMSIPYSEKSFNQFIEYKSEYINIVGRTAKSAWERGKRVYTTYQDRMTKPSYLKRLRMYESLIKGKKVEIDQIENIVFELAEKPKYSLLSFSIFSPNDLIEKKRPGYVPCPLAGDFKFRNGELQLNVFFRSHDALNFGYIDIYYLRQIQLYVLEEAKKHTKFLKLQKGKLGSLNLHFSRAYVPLRMEMKKKDYINGPEIDKILLTLMNNLRILCKQNNYNKSSKTRSGSN